jgi:UDP-glucose 4-epimerase
MQPKTKKILVTGGAGFIGSHTVVELIEAGYTPVIIDNFSNSTPHALQGIERITGIKPIFYELSCDSLSQIEQVFLEHTDIEAVIHFAAFKAVKESIDKPLQYYQNNLFSMVSLLQAMDKHDVKKLVFSSSCTVYGNTEQLPLSEEMPMLPTSSPYGRTKQMCESIIADYAHISKNFGCISLRYFNPIGAHPSGMLGELPIGEPNNLVPYITQTAAGVRQQLKVFGNTYPTPDGTALRDYVDVVDLAKAHLSALNRLVSNNNHSAIESFNLGSGKGISVLDVVNAFEQANSIKVNYTIAPRREGDVAEIFASTAKAEKQLGWSASTPLQESLKNAWNWEKTYRGI